jgi:hypothetical protein
VAIVLDGHGTPTTPSLMAYAHNVFSCAVSAAIESDPAGSRSRLSDETNVDYKHLLHVLNGQRPLTMDVALAVAAFYPAVASKYAAALEHILRLASTQADRQPSAGPEDGRLVLAAVRGGVVLDLPTWSEVDAATASAFTEQLTAFLQENQITNSIGAPAWPVGLEILVGTEDRLDAWIADGEIIGVALLADNHNRSAAKPTYDGFPFTLGGRVPVLGSPETADLFLTFAPSTV